LSKKTFVISDTHFYHNNILNYARPQFSSIEEMHNCIIDNWNSVVSPGDRVYHLGDAAMTSDQELLGSLLAKLNGSKRLVVGNHDDIKFLCKGGWFKKVLVWRKWKELGIILSHIPIHDFSRGETDDLLNIHGHTHLKGSPQGRYISACVEHTNFFPIEIEALIEKWKKEGYSKGIEKSEQTIS
jgi:calcineurin-like phosphoesterase family protein